MSGGAKDWSVSAERGRSEALFASSRGPAGDGLGAAPISRAGVNTASVMVLGWLFMAFSQQSLHKRRFLQELYRQLEICHSEPSLA